MSAYAAFNKNCAALPGTLDASEFDSHLRHGAIRYDTLMLSWSPDHVPPATQSIRKILIREHSFSSIIICWQALCPARSVARRLNASHPPPGALHQTARSPRRSPSRATCRASATTRARAARVARRKSAAAPAPRCKRSRTRRAAASGARPRRHGVLAIAKNSESFEPQPPCRA